MTHAHFASDVSGGASPETFLVSIEDFRLLREAKEEKRREQLLEEFHNLRASLAERQQGMLPEEADRAAQEFSDAVIESVIERAQHRFEHSS